MNKQGINRVYFIGIGGIGMSALARYYRSRGVQVSGYDLTPSPLTAELENEGMAIHYEDNPSLLPALIDVAVYTPAVPQDLNEIKELRRRGVPMMKRAEALGAISREHYTIAIAGTHGKTTTTAMVAHILHENNVDTTAFIGGIANNFGSNFHLGRTEESVLVVEADEFDRSFLQLSPNISIVNSMDADHLDIYGDKPQLISGFNAFARLTSNCVICKEELPLDVDDAILYRFGFQEPNDFRAIHIRQHEGESDFDIECRDSVTPVHLKLAGTHNVLNATVLMILVTCAVSSFLTEHAAKQIALSTDAPLVRDAVLEQLRLLLPVANPKNSPSLVDLATMVADPQTELHAMAVIRKPEDRQQVEQHLERVARMSASTDHRMNLHTQLAVNVSNGILNISTAEQITHIVAGFSDEGTGYGKALNPLLTTAEQGLWIYHPVQPLKTITNVRILAPEHAEKEPGYHDWRNLVARIVYQTRSDVTQEVMTDWSVLPRIADSTSENDLLVIVQARPSTVSYHPDMQQVPEVLKERFLGRGEGEKTGLEGKNFLVIFPRQNLGLQKDNPFFADYTRHSESSFALFERLHHKRHRS